MSYFTKIVFWGSLALLYLSPSVSNATHIVGGDMTYRFIEQVGENNRYIFTLKIFYDCFPADGQAANDSDSTITLAIYQKSNNPPETWRLVGTNGFSRMLSVRRSPLRTIANPTFECLVPPSNICIFEGIFEFEVIVKRSTLPYMISYQRCCRNGTISNLVQGGSTGANFFVELNTNVQYLVNQSPVFNNYPPTIICLGEPLVYDHSVTDADGDRVVYKFITATNSPGQLSASGCYPSPGSGNFNCPPHLLRTLNKQDAVYFPQYSATNPMGGNPQVRIDSLTGLITGTPNSLGQFVVSVAVEEWRGNVLLGRVFRDFQFNVVRCPKKAETIFNLADSSSYAGDKRFIIQKCDSTTVTILHNSRFREYITDFYWEFNINGTTRRFTDWFPKISFPDTGLYKGILWLNKGQRCYDSAYVDVLVGPGLKADLGIKFDTCAASPVVFTNNTRPSYYPIRFLRWELADTSFTERYPSVSTSVSRLYNTTGQKTVRLVVTNRFGCADDTVRTFFYQPMSAEPLIGASNTEACAPASFSLRNLTTPFDTSYRIRWDFGDGTSSASANPSISYPKAGVYPVKMTITNLAGCQKTATLRGGIRVNPRPIADFTFYPTTVNAAQGEVLFTDLSSTDAESFFWRFGGSGSALTRNPTYNFKDTGTQNIRLVVSNAFGCTDTVVKSIYVEPFASFFLPSAFTPNSDGINDEYVGVGETQSLREFTLKIYNRWGEVVFQTNSPNEAWNGRKNNAGYPLPDGVYLCQAQFRTYKGDFKEVKSYITLTR